LLLWVVGNDSSKQAFLLGPSVFNRITIHFPVALVPTPLPEPFIKLDCVEEPGRLPVAHVCSHSIGLPDYPSKNALRDRLSQALDGSNGSFGVLGVLLLLLSC
jgi:hypothetical protein